eukprot:990304-Amphidinium_carterae.1
MSEFGCKLAHRAFHFDQAAGSCKLTPRRCAGHMDSHLQSGRCTKGREASTQCYPSVSQNLKCGIITAASNSDERASSTKDTNNN